MTPSPSTTLDRDELERRITDMYRAVAHEAADTLHFPLGREIAELLGYPAALLDRLPAPAVASFAGVGHHLDLARLQPGEHVLDLGSGAGLDAFAAAEAVGPHGSVVGVDITPEQLAKAESLRTGEHVRFVRAHLEQLPFADGAFDVVISNGVLNLAPDKPRAFAEAARVLRPGGRLALSDIVTVHPIADRTASQADLWAACIAGASPREVYLRDADAAGLVVEVVRDNPPYPFRSDRAQRASAKYEAHSISLLARKPLISPEPPR
jgi:SAM-dependent methyltransferase